jgi:hypothetical protein
MSLGDAACGRQAPRPARLIICCRECIGTSTLHLGRGFKARFSLFCGVLVGCLVALWCFGLMAVLPYRRLARKTVMRDAPQPRIARLPGG